MPAKAAKKVPKPKSGKKRKLPADAQAVDTLLQMHGDAGPEIENLTFIKVTRQGKITNMLLPMDENTEFDEVINLISEETQCTLQELDTVRLVLNGMA